MNKQQQDYINGLTTAAATVLVKDSTDGDIFQRSREVMNDVVKSGVLEFDPGIQLRIYKALIEYRDSIREEKK